MGDYGFGIDAPYALIAAISQNLRSDHVHLSISSGFTTSHVACEGAVLKQIEVISGSLDNPTIMNAGSIGGY